jgi:hypothetical protein
VTFSLKILSIVVLLTLALAGCGGAESTGTSADPSSSETAGKDYSGMEFDEDLELSNPVDVLNLIEGCVVEPGVEMGQQDVDGVYYAECNFPDSGANVLVRVVGPEPEGYGNEDQVPDDSHKVIYGKDFYATITADPSVFGSEISVDAIAEEIGGTVAQ